MAPNYANLYMAYLEANHVFKLPHQLMYYRRYIDDIFMVYQHPIATLEDFQAKLNSIWPMIKFTFDCSSTQVTYLDINVIKQGNRLLVQPYFKPTNTFSYLLPSSYHHKAVFKGIYRGENIRLLRNSSNEATYLKMMDLLNQKFTDRGYRDIITYNPPEPFCNRHQYLTPNTKSKPDSLTIVCTLDKNTNRVPKRTLEHFQDTRKILYDKTVLFSYLNHPNIQQKVSKTSIEHTISSHNTTLYPIPTTTRVTYPARNIKCRTPGCATCPQIMERYRVVSYQTHQHYPIKDIYSCNTKSAIYLLECPLCFKQYIGETGTTIRNRMKHHRNASHRDVNRPIYRHLKEHDIPFENLRLTIIEQIATTTLRKQCELQLIRELKTKLPFGLNVMK